MKLYFCFLIVYCLWQTEFTGFSLAFLPLAASVTLAAYPCTTSSVRVL